jgi:hypothetical protein
MRAEDWFNNLFFFMLGEIMADPADGPIPVVLFDRISMLAAFSHEIFVSKLLAATIYRVK